MDSPQRASADRSKEGNSKTAKRKKPEQSQKSRKKKSKDDKKETGSKPTEQTTTVRSMDDINPAIIDIPHPEGSPFADAVSPDTLQFMADLAENNEREFMLLHNERWLKCKQDFTDFVGQVMEHARQLDPSILECQAKEAVYRLNRDLRFTNDKRPYKTFLSASFSRGGKKSPFAGYYLSVCPGNRSFIGAGLWSPSSAIISRIRQGIMEDPTLLRQALDLPMIEEIYGSKGVDALESDDRLKTAPKGVDKNHPDIDLLRYKSFVIGRRWDDQEVVSEGFLEKVTDAYEALVPFVTVLNAWTG
ncbi:hypothetical protein BC943DRAFT_283631 [Umbelopsis sp. AD052]|nr:hypothetical protein BC943DRAFT_283631 [Umbelopsis sp. AD052]